MREALIRSDSSSGTPLAFGSNSALEYLLDQWGLEFAEARHTMLFPRSLGFWSGKQVPLAGSVVSAFAVLLQRLGLTVNYEAHTGDVFERVLIACVLAEANAALAMGLENQIERELDYLLGCRRRDAVGGWSYFQHLRELPPDADNLAQIMQLVILAGPVWHRIRQPPPHGSTR